MHTPIGHHFPGFVGAFVLICAFAQVLSVPIAPVVVILLLGETLIAFQFRKIVRDGQIRNSISRRLLNLAFSPAPVYAPRLLFCGRKRSDVSLHPVHANAESTRVTPRHYRWGVTRWAVPFSRTGRKPVVRPQ